MHRCESSSIGGASPCQGEGRGFESRFPLIIWSFLEPGHLAQLVERFVYIEDVGGPSPSVATKIRIIYFKNLIITKYLKNILVFILY